MATGAPRARRPGTSTANLPQTLQALDRELLELEKKKLVQRRGDQYAVSIAGYVELHKRGLLRGRR